MKIIIALVGLLISSTFLFMGAFAQTTNLPNGFGTIVYESDDRYYVKDSHDNVIAGNNTPDLIIKTALDNRGDIYIANGTYKLSQYFSGFDLKSNTHLKLAPNANIVVPSGYDGYVFRFNSATSRSVLEGGNINEATPVQRNWIGILFTGGAVTFNYVRDMVISNPHIVIDFNTSSPSYISANTFANINANSYVIGIEFDFTGNYIHGSSGFFGNTFRDLQFESGPMTTYGAKGIRHQFNAFYNVYFWDLPGNARTTIDQSAEYTIIIGGAMTDRNYVDDGKNTILLDRLHRDILSNSTIISEIIKGTSNSELNMSTFQSYQDANTNLEQPPTTVLANGDHAQLVVSHGQPAMINIDGVVSEPRGGKLLVTITGPDGGVQQNDAYVTSAGTFNSPIMAVDRNSLDGQYNIDVSYNNSNLESLSFNIESGQVILPNEDNSNISTSPPSGSNVIPPISIKTSAKMWSQGKISDSVFVGSFQYLIKNGIVELPNQSQTNSNQSIYFPSWFKNNAGWWADGQISSGDFISELQYLLNNGIILISLQ